MILVLFALLRSPTASAQWQSTPWFHLEGAYVQRATKEERGPSLVTTRSGARGELGLALTRYLAVSAAGTYHDGGGSVTDAATSHFGGYTSDTRALVHVTYRPLVFTGGLANHENFATLPGVYRERTTLAYKPAAVTAFWGAGYLRYELELGPKGSISRTYADGGGGRTDLKFELGKVRGQAAEIGFVLPSTRYSTKLFLAWQKWTVDATSPESDGVDQRQIGRTEITTVTGGLGLAF